MYIAENLKSLRKVKDFTQEEVAEKICVSPQSVSKWERGECYPDITLLPSLANLYKVSLDALIGMDKINDAEARVAIFESGHEYLREGDNSAAERTFSDALKTFPNDEALMAELAMVLSLSQDADKLRQALSLCERVLTGSQSEKFRHTSRAALCFLHLKMGETEMASKSAENLPHIRESRESVLKQIKQQPTKDEIDAYLRFLTLGEDDQSDLILITCGHELIPLFEKEKGYDLLGKIAELREELGVPYGSDIDMRKLPVIRLRDDKQLPPKRLRFRHYADCLIDRDFVDLNEAATEVLETLRSIVIQ